MNPLSSKAHSLAQTRQTKHRTNRTENQHERATIGIWRPSFAHAQTLFSSVITRLFTQEIVKSYKVCFSFVLDYLDDGKIKKKLNEEQFKALFQFLNPRDTFVCLTTGDEKTLIYHTAVLVARIAKGENSAI